MSWGWEEMSLAVSAHPERLCWGRGCHTAPLCVWEQLEASGRVLQLGKALPGDAARYTCVATNAAGEAQQHTRLHVHGNAPKRGCPRGSCTWAHLALAFLLALHIHLSVLFLCPTPLVSSEGKNWLLWSLTSLL